MTDAPTAPLAGRAWPPRARGTGTRFLQPATRLPASMATAELEAELARDLAALVENGLVVPIRDGETLRYSLATDSEGAEQ